MTDDNNEIFAIAYTTPDGAENILSLTLDTGKTQVIAGPRRDIIESYWKYVCDNAPGGTTIRLVRFTGREQLRMFVQPIGVRRTEDAG